MPLAAAMLFIAPMDTQHNDYGAKSVLNNDELAAWWATKLPANAASEWLGPRPSTGAADDQVESEPPQMGVRVHF